MTNPNDVERIAALPDPVVRNLMITQAYHELATAINARIPGSANWCTYAVWASKQAGQSIRQEDLTDTARRLIQNSERIQERIERTQSLLHLERVDVYDLIARIIERHGTFEATAAAIAVGNQLVFAEIGYHCSRFVEFLDAYPDYQEAALEDFLEPLSLGQSPNGQGMLRDAFRAYYRARYADTLKQRAEGLLLGSFLIGYYHEQIRLQEPPGRCVRGAQTASQVGCRALLSRVAREVGSPRSVTPMVERATAG